MKKFILSDLHIGYPNSQYNIMDEAIEYISQKAEDGDQIWGLGDWFHMKEMGYDCCISHSMTQKFRDLAGRVTTRLIPGNHDSQLEDYHDNPSLVNPINPIEIINPFWENGYLYCHGHEFDPVARHFGWFPAFWDRLVRKKTPGELRAAPIITEKFLIAAYTVHGRAQLGLPSKAKEDGQDYKGIVLGHTHLPLIQDSPELPNLLNSGDMRDSATFILQDDDGFHLMRWDYDHNHWLAVSRLRP